MLPIRQTILALPHLGSTNKVVLSEVCQLAEAGGGWCRATNPYLATALGKTERTITRRLAALEEDFGLLTSIGEGKARRLAPSPALRACYAAADEAARAAAVATLNLDTLGTNLDTPGTPNLDTLAAQPRHFEPANLDTLGSESTQSVQVEAPNLDTLGAEPRHFGSTNLDTLGRQPRHFGSRVIGDHQDHQLDHQDQLTASERWAFQKKIGDLQHEVANLKAQLARVKAPPVAGRPPAGYRDFAAPWPEQLRPPFAAPAFLPAWALFAGHRAEIGKPFQGHIGEQQALDTLGCFAAGDMQRALRILSHHITEGYRTLNNDDGTKPSRPAASGGQRGAGAGRVETLEPTRYGRNRGPAQPPTPDTERPAEAA